MKLDSLWDLVQVKPLSKGEYIQSTKEIIPIIYVLEGEVSIKVENETSRITSGGFFILESPKLYKTSKVNGNVFLISFDYNNAIFKEQNQYYIFNGDSNESASPVKQEFEMKMNKILKIFAFQHEYNIAYVYESYFGIIALLEKYFGHKKYQSNLEDNLRSQINEVKFYLEKNYSKNISLSKVAASFFVSASYLSKVFKNEIGISFSKYLLQIRLDAVKESLVTSEESIINIALDTGFSNVNSFNRLFKSNIGITPSEYRQKNKATKSRLQNSESNINTIGLHQTLTKHFSKQDNQKTSENESLQLISRNISLSKTRKFSKIWNSIINIGYASDILQKSVEQQMQTMQHDLSVKYGRVWGILSDKMIMEKEIDGEIHFNFQIIDKVIEILLNLKLKPFLDLGIKPKMIIGENYEIQTYPSSYKQRTIEEWGVVVNEFVSHCVNKFGYGEVSEWYFEFWKPSKLVLEHTHMKEALNQNVYKNELFIKYFSSTYQAIKAIVPEVKVGGGGISLDITNEDTTELMKEWLQSNYPPDFLTFTVFPMDHVGQKLSLDENYTYMKLRDMHQFLKTMNSKVEVIVAEFNITISNRHPINDSLFKASYIVKNYLENINHSDMMAYWLLSDVFSYSGGSQRLLYGGAGIISKDGIKKPSYYAFEFLSCLGNELLEQGKGYMITKKTGQSLQILLYHYTHFGIEIYFPDKKDGRSKYLNESSNIDKSSSIRFQFEINGFENRKYRKKYRRINKNTGSIIDRLSDFEKKATLREEEINYHRSVCLPSMIIEELLIDDKKIVIDEEISEQEIMLIEIDLIY